MMSVSYSSFVIFAVFVVNQSGQFRWKWVNAEVRGPRRYRNIKTSGEAKHGISVILRVTVLKETRSLGQ